VTRAGAARWTEWALRLSLATAFLSGVADRLGAWGPHGSPHASWGDWHHFRIYADRLNWYMPAAVQPAAAVLATAGEVIFAIALITGFRLREAAIGSGVLLTIFRDFDGADPRNEGAAPDYSVFTAATASLSLAVMAADHKREIREGGNHESTVELSAGDVMSTSCVRS
jgi:uncharacterized membrane protein YphA (DoxX/SURF4 family)